VGYDYRLTSLPGFISIKLSFFTEPALKDVSKEMAIIVLGVVIVSLIQVKILGDFYQQQSVEAIEPSLIDIKEQLLKEIDRVIPELKTETVQSIRETQQEIHNIIPDIKSESVRILQDTQVEIKRIIPEVKTETIKSIQDIQNRVTDATNFMLTGIDVLQGAKIAGFTNIYPTRYEKISGKSVVDTIKDDLNSESSRIRLMGISLGDYFLDRGVLHNSFTKLLETNIHNDKPEIQALLVHPKCETLRERARWEAGPDYYNEPAFFDSTTYIETDGAARIAKRLCEKYIKILHVRLYRQAPTAFVLLTSRFAFVEAYNYSARGSNVPVFQVQAGSPLYMSYENHFDRIWSVATPIGEYEPFSKEDVKNVLQKK
jgi:gas vesicle protein